MTGSPHPLAAAHDELVWLATPVGPVAGWRSPVGPGSAGLPACVILPPVGYPYWSSHDTLRRIGDELAASGVPTLRIDYHGTGDSTGTGWEGDRLGAWRDSVTAAIALMSENGSRPVGLIGIQLGAALALERLGDVAEPAFVVAVDPILSGRRFVRQLRMLSQPVPEAAGTPGLIYAGFPLPDALLHALGTLGVTDVEQRSSVPILALATDAGGLSALERAMGPLSEEVTVLAWPTTVLQVPAEEAEVPTALVSDVLGWVEGVVAHEGAGRERLPRADGGATTGPESLVELGRSCLVGLASTPAGGTSTTIVVFLNSGSESHIGPGRAWVAYSRALDAAGFGTLRLDFSGWGESPDLGHAPGRPYDAHCLTETLEVVQELHDRGHRVVLVGLCAGAWVALRAVSVGAPVAGVMAINPQLYWSPGDPVEALISTTIERRAPDRDREARGARWGWWSALDALGLRGREGRWLDRLAQSQTLVRLLFSESDEGLTYLRTRLARRLRRATRRETLSVVEVPGIDHAMHRAWRRGAVEDELVRLARAVELRRG